MTVPTFNGTQKSFPMFWTKFKAFGGMKGFGAALKETPEAALPISEDVEVDDGTPAGKAKS